MPSEEDLWEVARQLVQQHGDEAEIVVATWQKDFLEAGDEEAFLAWRRIGRMITEIRQAESQGSA